MFIPHGYISSRVQITHHLEVALVDDGVQVVLHRAVSDDDEAHRDKAYHVDGVHAAVLVANLEDSVDVAARREAEQQLPTGRVAMALRVSGQGAVVQAAHHYKTEYAEQHGTGHRRESFVISSILPRFDSDFSFEISL